MRVRGARPPLSLYQPSRANLWCTPLLRGQIHSYFYSALSTSVVTPLSLTIMIVFQNIANTGDHLQRPNCKLLRSPRIDYSNPIPARFLAPIDFLKFQHSLTFQFNLRCTYHRVHILVEMKQVIVSAHSAGAYTATLLARVNVMRGGGRAPPTLTSQD